MTASLSDAVRAAGSPVELLRNSQSVPQVVPTVPPEYTNWRDEQRAWDETCALFDQSHHMVTITMTGADVIPTLATLSTNDFSTFGPGKAKQLITCSSRGHLIGQGILFHLGDRILLVGPHPVMDWVEFVLQTRTAGLDVHYSREGTSLTNSAPPSRFRFQLQGPNAFAVMRDALGQEPPALPFFGIGEASIAGTTVGMLRHGMAAEPGYEFWGPWSARDAVLETVLTAGEPHGLARVGGLAYFSTGVHSGYIAQVVPAIYTDPEFAEYRDWLDDGSYEATAPLGGSLVSANIEDYYVTPFDLDYGRSISLSHDFMGRDALAAMIESGSSARRTKVTLEFDADDVTAVYRSFFDTGSLPGLFMQPPLPRVASLQYDRITVEGRPVGFSSRPAFSAIHRSVLSLAVVDTDVAAEGTRVTVAWGEEPNSRKLRVDAHRVMELTATVRPTPIAKQARDRYKAND